MDGSWLGGVFSLTTTGVNWEWGFAVRNDAGHVLYEVGTTRNSGSGCVDVEPDGRPCRSEAPLANPPFDRPGGKQCAVLFGEFWRGP